MKRKNVYLPLLGFIIITLILNSCSTSDKVTTSNIIQKRKYNKGYYVNLSSEKQKNIQNNELSLQSLKPTETAINKPQDVIDKSSYNETNRKEDIDNIIASTEKIISPGAQQINIFNLTNMKIRHNEQKKNNSFEKELKNRLDNNINMDAKKLNTQKSLEVWAWIIGIIGGIIILVILIMLENRGVEI